MWTKAAKEWLSSSNTETSSRMVNAVRDREVNIIRSSRQCHRGGCDEMQTRKLIWDIVFIDWMAEETHFMKMEDRRRYLDDKN